MTAITSIEDGALNNMLYEDDATIDSLSIESPDENKYSTGVVKHMGWNELKSMAHIFANEKCMLERIRFDEDDNQYKIKNAVVPKPKPTMPTRGKNGTRIFYMKMIICSLFIPICIIYSYFGIWCNWGKEGSRLILPI